MAYDYIKLGIKKINNKKQLIFSDMGFLHEDNVRDEYDAMGYGTNTGASVIQPIARGNHLITASIKKPATECTHKIVYSGENYYFTITFSTQNSQYFNKFISTSDFINALPIDSTGEIRYPCTGTLSTDGKNLKNMFRTSEQVLVFYYQDDSYTAIPLYVFDNNFDFHSDTTTDNSINYGSLEFQVYDSSTTPLANFNAAYNLITNDKQLPCSGIVYWWKNEGLLDLPCLQDYDYYAMKKNDNDNTLTLYWDWWGWHFKNLVLKYEKRGSGTTVIDINTLTATKFVDLVAGPNAYKGQIIQNKSSNLSTRVIRHIPYGVKDSARPIPTLGGQVTAGQIIANSNAMTDCRAAWEAIGGNNKRILELLVSTNADGGIMWISQQAYSNINGTNQPLLELASSLDSANKTITMTIRAWLPNAETPNIISEHTFDIPEDAITYNYDKQAEWCFVKKNGRLCIQYTPRIAKYKSYDFFEHVMTNVEECESGCAVLQQMFQSDGQFILSDNSSLYVRGRTRQDDNTQKAGYWLFDFDSLTSSHGTIYWRNVPNDDNEYKNVLTDYPRIIRSGATNPTKISLPKFVTNDGSIPSDGTKVEPESGQGLTRITVDYYTDIDSGAIGYNKATGTAEVKVYGQNQQTIFTADSGWKYSGIQYINGTLYLVTYTKTVMNVTAGIISKKENNKNYSYVRLYATGKKYISNKKSTDDADYKTDNITVKFRVTNIEQYYDGTPDTGDYTV